MSLCPLFFASISLYNSAHSPVILLTMAPISTSSILATDATSPSVPKHIIRHRWEGSKYTCADGNFTLWTKKLKDMLILNRIYSHVFNEITTHLSLDIEPHTYANWALNNHLAITFIKSALDDTKHHDLLTNKGAATCFSDLKT